MKSIIYRSNDLDFLLMDFVFFKDYFTFLSHLKNNESIKGSLIVFAPSNANGFIWQLKGFLTTLCKDKKPQKIIIVIPSGIEESRVVKAIPKWLSCNICMLTDIYEITGAIKAD